MCIAQCVPMMWFTDASCYFGLYCFLIPVVANTHTYHSPAMFRFSSQGGHLLSSRMSLCTVEDKATTTQVHSEFENWFRSRMPASIPGSEKIGYRPAVLRAGEGGQPAAFFQPAKIYQPLSWIRQGGRVEKRCPESGYCPQGARK